MQEENLSSLQFNQMETKFKCFTKKQMFTCMLLKSCSENIKRFHENIHGLVLFNSFKRQTHKMIKHTQTN